ncbi:hypothetical protein THAOC_08843, partial [Thalassiosira oceanica]
MVAVGVEVGYEGWIMEWMVYMRFTCCNRGSRWRRARLAMFGGGRREAVLDKVRHHFKADVEGDSLGLLPDLPVRVLTKICMDLAAYEWQLSSTDEERERVDEQTEVGRTPLPAPQATANRNDDYGSTATAAAARPAP